MQNGNVDNFEREENKFTLVRQKIVLNVDFHQKCLSGFVELDLVPGQSLKLIQLNCQQAIITDVFVGSTRVQEKLRNFTDQICLKETDQIGYKTFFEADLAASNAEGELIIPVPEHELQQFFVQSEMSPTMKVTIHYSVTNPRCGCYFVLPSEHFPKRRAHMYTQSAVLGARFWLPCVDDLITMPEWEMEYTVDKGMTAISSGELIRRHDMDEKTTFYFKQLVPTSASNILFAAGTFDCVETRLNNINLNCYCLPSRKLAMENCTKFLSGVIHFLESYLKINFPFPTFNMVFVDEAYCKVSSGSSIAIVSANLLHTADIIDQTYVTRHLLTLACTQQWFGCYIKGKLWSDSWLFFGLSGFLALLYYQKMFGMNEFKFKLHSYINYVLESPMNEPLYCNEFTCPTEFYTKLFFKKSVVVMYLIEHHISTDNFKKVLFHLLKPNSHLLVSTRYFLEQIKKLSGFDMKAFAEKWIYSLGSPLFKASFSFNKTKYVTEVMVEQDLTPAINKKSPAIIPTFERPKFNTPMTVKIVETDSEKKLHLAEHRLGIQDNLLRTEFQSISRPKKSRSAQAQVAKLQQQMQIECAAGNTGIRSPMVELKSPSEQNETKVTTLEPPVQWIRFDPHMQLMAKIIFHQPENMWINQLDQDKDVIAQLEAITNLAQFNSKDTIKALSKALSNNDYFYRVRMRAAYTMAYLSGPSNDWVGLEYLFNFFKSNYFYTDPLQVKPLSFQTLSNAFIQKSVAYSISLVKDKNGYTPNDVVDFLLHLLRNADNSYNTYSDCYYIAAVIHSLSNVSLNPISKARQQIVDKMLFQVNRYLSIDRLMPCYGNVISIACISTLAEFQIVKKYCPEEPNLFRQLVEYGNSLGIRFAAAKALVSYGLARFIDGNRVIHILLDVITNDPFSSSFAKLKIMSILVEPNLETYEWDTDQVVHQALKNSNRYNLNLSDSEENSLDMDEDKLEKNEEILKKRYEMFFASSSEEFVNLRKRLWKMLNTKETRDFRFRLVVLQLYCLLGGELDSIGRFNGVRLYRPPNPQPNKKTHVKRKFENENEHSTEGSGLMVTLNSKNPKIHANSHPTRSPTPYGIANPHQKSVYSPTYPKIDLSSNIMLRPGASTHSEVKRETRSSNPIPSSPYVPEGRRERVVKYSPPPRDRSDEYSPPPHVPEGRRERMVKYSPPPREQRDYDEYSPPPRERRDHYSPPPSVPTSIEIKKEEISRSKLTIVLNTNSTPKHTNTTLSTPSTTHRAHTSPPPNNQDLHNTTSSNTIVTRSSIHPNQPVHYTPSFNHAHSHNIPTSPTANTIVTRSTNVHTPLPVPTPTPVPDLVEVKKEKLPNLTISLKRNPKKSTTTNPTTTNPTTTNPTTNPIIITNSKPVVNVIPSTERININATPTIMNERVNVIGTDPVILNPVQTPIAQTPTTSTIPAETKKASLSIVLKRPIKKEPL